jgi:hypothetical protein
MKPVKFVAICLLLLCAALFPYSAELIHYTTNGSSGAASVEPGFSFNSIWTGLGWGKNQHIYAAVCNQLQSALWYNSDGRPHKGDVCVVTWNPYTRTMKSCGTVKSTCLKVANWMANESQEKIHTHLSPAADGRVWMATHDNDGAQPGDDTWYSGLYYRGSHILYVDVDNGDTLVDYSKTQKYYYKKDSPLPSLMQHGLPASDTVGLAFQFHSIMIMGHNPYNPRYLWTMSLGGTGYIQVWDIIEDTTRTVAPGDGNMRDFAVGKDGSVYYTPSGGGNAYKRTVHGQLTLLGTGLPSAHGSITYSRSFDSAFTINGNGQVVLWDMKNDAVRQIANLPSGSGGRNYRTAVTSRNGRQIYTLGPSNRVYEITIATGAYSSIYTVSQLSGYSYATGNMAVDTLGNMYTGLHNSTSNASRLLAINLGKDKVWPLDIPDPSQVEAQPKLANGRADVLSAYPNPFNSGVKIAVSGQRIADSNIEIAIYNTNGKIVQKLSATSYQLSAGITWDASGLPPGVYMARLSVGRKIYSKKLILIK